MKNTINSKFEDVLLLTIIIGVLTLTRIIPHPWNLTATSAIALFAGARIGNKVFATLVPLAAFLVSDLILGLHSTILFTYFAIVLIVFAGQILVKNENPFSIIGASLVSSVIFFLISNYGVWAVDQIYPMTIDGLVSCYVAGIPFFKNQILGDLFYSSLAFFAFAKLSKRAPVTAL